MGVTNDTLACIDGLSDSIANAQTTASPWVADAESLATSASGEIQRLRYVLENFLGLTNWYRIDNNINFATGSAVDGSGLGRHVTAVGYHSWSGSLRWPAITSVGDHTSGLFWPLAHHAALGFDATQDTGKYGLGQTNARTWYVFHAEALTLHHTAAIRFASSENSMHNGQRGHVTALRVRIGGGFADDSIILGHSGSRLSIESAHISGGSNQVLAVSATGLLSTTASTTTGMWGSRGQFSGAGRQPQAGFFFTLSAHAVTFINASTHAAVQVMRPADVNVDITASGPAAAGRDRSTAFSASTWIHFYWIYDGTTVSGIASVNAPIGPNVAAGGAGGGGPNLTGLAYTSWSYAGAVRLDSNTDIVPVHILGSMAYYHQGVRALSTGNSTSEATVELNTMVPPNATETKLNASARLAANGGEATIRYSTGGGRKDYFRMASGGAAVDYRDQAEITIPNISQRIFYITIQAGGTVSLDIDVLGYRLPNGG